MTQTGVVTKVIDDNRAIVSVLRTTACGGNCSECESCAYNSEISTVAENSANAVAGEKVIIETKSSSIYRVIVLVYILPVVLMIFSYFLAAGYGLTEKMCILISFLTLLILSVLVIVLRNKINSRKIEYKITHIL